MRTRGQCEHVDGRGHVQDWRGDAGRREQDRRGVPGEGGGEWTGQVLGDGEDDASAVQ